MSSSSPDEKPLGADENPLRSSDSRVWDWLIESIGPASMLVAIGRRMSDDLHRRHGVEDVWQETLLQAWRGRASCEWHGLKSFRRWLLAIAENTLRGLADREHAKKRGGGASASAAAERRDGDSSAGSEFAGPTASTTPSRAASDAERARRMRAALDSLPGPLRVVVFLRLFEERTFDEVAERIGTTVSGARHRFLRGFELYHAALGEALHRRTGGTPA